MYRERDRQTDRQTGRQRETERDREREVNQVVSSKHIFLSFKPLKHQLIKRPNKQKTNLLFLCFDILSLSTILSFHIEFTIPYICTLTVKVMLQICILICTFIWYCLFLFIKYSVQYSGSSLSVTFFFKIAETELTRETVCQKYSVKLWILKVS